MYIDELIEVFKSAVSDHPELDCEEVISSLTKGLEDKKYDLQDQGLIEAILREDKHELADSLKEGLQNLESGDKKKEAVNIFIASLEHLINYYYNNVIGKHFSST
ncbi:MAG: hypothetical protein AAF462_09220 [Thermodesulfobacteriota bacterium]